MQAHQATSPYHEPILPIEKAGAKVTESLKQPSYISNFVFCVVLGKWREELLLKSTNAADSEIAEEYIRERNMLPPLVCEHVWH